jgi:hypothetical protein
MNLQSTVAVAVYAIIRHCQVAITRHFNAVSAIVEDTTVRYIKVSQIIGGILIQLNAIEIVFGYITTG